jgi:hypothetical protein
MPSRRVRHFAFGLILVSGCGSRAATAAENFNSHANLKQAILDGKDIHVTLDLAACFVHETEKPGPSIRGSLHFDGYMIESDETIAFATTHFTVKPDNTPVDEFLSFKVSPVGKVKTRTRVLNPSTFAVIHDVEFDCEVGKGIAFRW